jgi:hypothetical protein
MKSEKKYGEPRLEGGTGAKVNLKIVAVFDGRLSFIHWRVIARLSPFSPIFLKIGEVQRKPDFVIFGADL